MSSFRIKSSVDTFFSMCPLIDHSYLSHSRTLGLGEEFADVFSKRYGEMDYEWGIAGASTDFVRLHHICSLMRTLTARIFIGRGTCHTVGVQSFSVCPAADDDDVLQ